MSLRAYMKAVKNQIQTTYSVDQTGCDVTPDGRPVPVAGQVFYAVHPGTITNSRQNALDEQYGFSVTLTMRTGYAPWDRVGSNVIADDSGLLAKAEALRVLLNMNYTVMAAANALIPNTPAAGGSTVTGFVEPLVIQSVAYLGVKGPDWFFAEGVDDSATGVAVELRFGRARRVQDVSGST